MSPGRGSSIHGKAESLRWSSLGDRHRSDIHLDKMKEKHELEMQRLRAGHLEELQSLEYRAEEAKVLIEALREEKALGEAGKETELKRAAKELESERKTVVELQDILEMMRRDAEKNSDEVEALKCRLHDDVSQEAISGSTSNKTTKEKEPEEWRRVSLLPGLPAQNGNAVRVSLLPGLPHSERKTTAGKTKMMSVEERLALEASEVNSPCEEVEMLRESHAEEMRLLREAHQEEMTGLRCSNLKAERD